MAGYEFDKEADAYVEFVRKHKDGLTMFEFAEELKRRFGAETSADGNIVIFRLPKMHSHLSVPRVDLYKGTEKEGTFHISDDLNNTESKYREYYKYDTLNYSTADNKGNKPRIVAAGPAPGKLGLSVREMMAARAAPAAAAVDPEIAELEARIKKYQYLADYESNPGKIKNYEKEVRKATESLAKLRGSARRKTRRLGQGKYRAKSSRASGQKRKTRRTR